MSQDFTPQGRTALRALLGAIALAAAAAAQADIVNFDGLADGTQLTNQYPGLTFTNPVGGNVFARMTTAARSPSNVVSVFQTGVPMYGAFYGAVDVEFATLQRSVSIDAAAGRTPEGLGTPNNRPFLQAFDANGALLTTVYFQGALPDAGGVTAYETLNYTAASAVIKKVRISVQQTQPGPPVYGYFDNLSYSTSASAQARMYDDFMPSKWVQSQAGTGVTILQANGKADFVIAANATGQSIMGRWDSTCKLRGDFDLTVDWALPSYVPKSGVRLAFAAGEASIERTGLGPADFYPTGDYYIQQIWGNYGAFTPTSHTNGRFRISRIGSNYRVYYQPPTGGAWVLAQEGFGSTADATFSLMAFTGQGAFTQQKVTARFDNMQVYSGTTVGTNCP